VAEKAIIGENGPHLPLKVDLAWRGFFLSGALAKTTWSEQRGNPGRRRY
jgi:hypothetical protein